MSKEQDSVPVGEIADTSTAPSPVPLEIEEPNTLATVTLRGVSITFTVLLLFTPVRQDMSTKEYHPCYIDKLNFNIPNTARINSLMNSLCDNVFKIDKEHFNQFGLGAMGYDLFFFQDRIPDDDDDPFNLVLTERSHKKTQHTVGMRFKNEYEGGKYENIFDSLSVFVDQHKHAFQLHLVTAKDLVTFRSMVGLEQTSHGFDPSESYQWCFLRTLLDFQDYTVWRLGAMNGQNRLASGLSLCVGCNFDLQNWVLKPGSIQSRQLLDLNASEDEDTNVIAEHKIYGQPVGIIPPQNRILDYVNRARIGSKLTSGVRFSPPVELRVVSDYITNLERPTASLVIDELNQISQRRAVDERMLSSTSMPAKCASILTIVCEEIVRTYEECKEFHSSYQGTHCDPSAKFKEQYPNYCSESEIESPPTPVKSKKSATKSPQTGKKATTGTVPPVAKKPANDSFWRLVGPKWNWMSFTDERWATSHCCQRMFVDSTLQKPRESYVQNQLLSVGEHIDMPYTSNKLLPVFPVWWQGTASSSIDERRLMCRHFIDPSPQQLSTLFQSMITNVHMPKFNGSIDSKGAVVSNRSVRSKRELRGMPVFNSISIAGPVTKLAKPAGNRSLQDEFNVFNGASLRSKAYSYEERFLEPLLPLIVHYYYEVVHGPDYVRTHKGHRFCDTLLCLGNLKAFSTVGKPAVDKIAMDYIFHGRDLPFTLNDVIHECPAECFDYDELIYQDRMMSSPHDVGSITRFYSNVMVVANLMTSREVRHKKRSVSKPLFARKVAALFETLEDKTSTTHRETVAVYGMMAMFSVRFSYRISQLVFRYRPNNGDKTYHNDLLPSVIARVELNLVHHILLLLDQFGLFPALKKDLDLENPLEKDITSIFCVYNRMLVSTSVFEGIIEDEERDMDVKRQEADAMLDRWDQFFRSSNRGRATGGVAWPLKPGDVNRLPPIAHVLLAWGFYIGERFRLIEERLIEMGEQDESIGTLELGRAILDDDSLNMCSVFRGYPPGSVLLKQITKDGTHAWGGNKSVRSPDSPLAVADTGLYLCFEILSTKQHAFNLIDFASKVLQPKGTPPQFDSSRFLRTTSSISLFEAPSQKEIASGPVELLTPAALKRSWTVEDLIFIRQGKLPQRTSKAPKLCFFKNAPTLLAKILAMRKDPTSTDAIASLLQHVDVSYGSGNCEVQMVNMIKLQNLLELSDEHIFDRQTYNVLHEYCTVKKLPYDLLDLEDEEVDIEIQKETFLLIYPKVKRRLVPLLKKADGFVPAGRPNYRSRDRKKKAKRSKVSSAVLQDLPSDALIDKDASNDEHYTDEDEDNDARDNNKKESSNNDTSKEDEGSVEDRQANDDNASGDEEEEEEEEEDSPALKQPPIKKRKAVFDSSDE
eukprot:CCRYP_005884-RA/>CCRYP_005884-RA protein AED:0.05 eAED:0.05 QI:1003/1/0.8/1/0.75/0.4/5/0/1380